MDDAGVQRIGEQVSAVVDSELGGHVGPVAHDCAFAEAEKVRYLLVRVALDYQFEDLPFSLCQGASIFARALRRQCPHVLENGLSHLRRQVATP